MFKASFVKNVQYGLEKIIRLAESTASFIEKNRSLMMPNLSSVLPFINTF